MLSTVWLLATLTVSLAPEPNSTVIWPQWRGPTRDGIVASTTPWPNSLKPNALKLRWASDKLAPSYSGPIVSSDAIFTTETVDKKTEVVTAYDRQTGKVKWKKQWDGSLSVPFFAAANGSWIRATPAFDGTHLYVAGIRDQLYKLDAATGDVKWSVDFVAKYGTQPPAFGFVSSPLIEGNSLYVQAAAGLVKVDTRTGEVAWRVLVAADDVMTGSAFSSPTLAKFADKECLLVQTRTELAAVEKTTGSTLWKRAIPSFRGMNVLTPIQVNDSVLTATYGGTTQLIKIIGSSEAGFTATDGWALKYEGNMSTPVVVAGHAYLLGKDQKLTCIDLKSGKRTWTSDKTYGKYWSLVAAGDKILALDQRGILYLLKANPKELEILDERVVAKDAWAHLAVVGNEVIIRSLDALTVYTWDTAK
jgi:outer membrane protein assembly factor BamB